MENRNNFQSLTILTLITFIQFFSTYGQISTPCTSSMMNNFIPCVGSIMGSSRNGVSATSSCCDTFKSTMSKSMDCACLIITGNVPFPSFISQALASTLPQACGSSMPLQCKSSGVLLPPPGPVLFAPPPPPPATVSPHRSPVASPDISPVASSPHGSTVSKVLALVAAPAEAPGDLLSPSFAPDADAHIRPVFTPSTSTAASNCAPLPYIVFAFVAIIIFNYFQVV